jgi:hypothetical protein
MKAVRFWVGDGQASFKEHAGLNRFVASVKDIQLFLRTYSNSGN